MPDVHLDIPGARVPLVASWRAGQADTLVVSFHGSYDRKLRATPLAMPFFNAVEGAHQINVPDPTLERFRDLACCWYLGVKGQDLWIHLSREILRFSDSIGARRRIYVGGSSGGFAALLYASLDPGSTVIAANPQTNLFEHVYPGGITSYFWLAWKTERGEMPAPELGPFNMNTLYAGNVAPAAIVYLQSPADFKHLKRQAIPFVQALPADCADRLVLEWRFEGIHGHGGSVRRETVQRWIAACARAYAADAPYTARQLLDTKFAIDNERDAALSRGQDGPRRGGGAAAAFDPADLRTARQISDILLKEGPR